MLNLLLVIVGWSIGLSILMSFLEHQVHQRLMHSKSHLAGRLGALQRTFEHHAIQHHGHYRQIFSDEPVAPGEDRGLRLNLKEGFLEGTLLGLLLVPFSVTAAMVFPFIVCSHHFLWNLVHLEMHKPEQRFFARWGLYKFLARHHYLHHRYPSKNFNVVLPFADFVLGTQARASADDLTHLNSVGLL